MENGKRSYKNSKEINQLIKHQILIKITNHVYIYMTEKKHYLNKIVVKSNVIMATDAAEVTRKWRGIQKRLQEH